MRDSSLQAARNILTRAWETPRYPQQCSLSCLRLPTLNSAISLRRQQQQQWSSSRQAEHRRRRFFSSTRQRWKDGEGSATEKAKALNQKGLDDQEQELDYDKAIANDREKQIRTPWHREGSDKPPVRRQFSAGAMTRGKLLTTPSRLLKLILPLTTLDHNTDRKDIEPLALLVHPQQPLSYLERLIQSELPSITDKDGKIKIPAVHFRAKDYAQDEIKPRSKTSDEKEKEEDEEEEESNEGENKGEFEETLIDGKVIKTGKLRQEPHDLRGGPGEGGVESYGSAGREAGTPNAAVTPRHVDKDSANRPEPKRFVRWSTSTEIGDFIRDAARGKEFAVEIEGAGKEIRVGVPSFNDRTHYLRTRLRKTAGKIMAMQEIKKECDNAAHKGAQRLAMGGLAGLVGWWYAVYWLTFETSLGWDTMEPVTYLVGLSAVVMGYTWFLYHNREVSYRSALNLTISRRQTKLYQARGFDLARWEGLMEEANALRKEIKAVASEYDVDWDELADAKEEEVVDAMRESRKQKEKEGGGEKKKKGDDGDDGDD
ncbi:hypothetical protein MMC25_007049 [Agyrium rufum]|nr:hypothetical protein [Agyrium rufum]